MKNAEVESENVIKISFGAAVPNHIAHPASKNYPESLPEGAQELDCEQADPLEALLREGEAVGFTDFAFEEEEDTYIHAHQQPFKHAVDFSADASELACGAIERLRRLKEDSKRLRYYLDELNID